MITKLTFLHPLLNRMKLFSILFFMLLSCITALAQNTVTISGNIDHPKSTSVQLFSNLLHLENKNESVSTALKDGQFVFSSNLTHTELVELVSEDFRQVLFIEPGDDLQLQVKNNVVTITGKGSEQNTFLQKFNDQFKNDFQDTIMQPKIFTTGVDAFEIMIFNNRKKQNDFFKKESSRDKFSTAFSGFMANNILYRYWNLLFAYPIANANSNTGLIVSPLPAIMLEDFPKVTVNNDAALLCESYREFLKYYVVYTTSKANGFNKFTDFSISAEKKLTVAKEQLKGEAFKFWLAKFTIDECSRLSPYMTNKLFSALKAVDVEGNYSSKVNEICGQKMAMKDEKPKKANESSGQPIKKDELDLTDVNGKHVSLSDFKGKVVYIDFWASWCGPCKRMMPFSKQMHDNLDDKQKKQIVFLYISIDADQNAWKKGIQDLGIEGENVISPGNWNSKVCKYFQINSIPRYMIMNKKGDIVDFNAKRPSDTMVLDELLRLVGE